MKRGMQILGWFILIVWLGALSVEALTRWISPAADMLPETADSLDLLLVILVALGVLLSLVTALIALLAIVGWTGLKSQMDQSVRSTVQETVYNEMERRANSEVSGQSRAEEYTVDPSPPTPGDAKEMTDASGDEAEHQR